VEHGINPLDRIALQMSPQNLADDSSMFERYSPGSLLLRNIKH
jgi:hypothetical protein